MPERALIDRLDEAVETMLRRPERASVPPDAELATLWRVAADLVDLPRREFRARLAEDLRRRAMGPTTAPEASKSIGPIPEGLRSITPYLVVGGAARLIDFMKRAFGAEERLRVERADGSIQHAAVRIGDSVVELGDGLEAWPARPAAIHLYVPDADAVYARAIEAGATSLLAPADMPYGDREGDVTDPFGNNWYIGTRRQGGPIPAGLHTVTPTLHVEGTDGLIDFVRRAFGADELDRTVLPDGTVVHAQLRLGDSVLELGEARGFVSPMPCSIHYYVDDVDAAYARALEAGATSLGAPSDRPYGDRAAEVADPFGNHWFLATHVANITP
ncbi:MAG: VOC family protein [Vicinamibacteria bacterium]